jgi:hypothetical protein
LLTLLSGGACSTTGHPTDYGKGSGLQAADRPARTLDLTFMIVLHD